MDAFWSGEGRSIYNGDALDVLRSLPNDSADSLVTDPPSGTGFMGKDWDKNRGSSAAWIDWLTGIVEESLRVLKPGAHCLVWSLPRTSHWTGSAVERGGFLVRDTITHIFKTGFPKNHDIAKALDKAAGVQPIGEREPTLGMTADKGYNTLKKQYIMPPLQTAAAKKWKGWGTALKPAKEVWWLGRAPLARGHSIAENVRVFGTGALNIDASMVGSEIRKIYGGVGGFDFSFDPDRGPHMSQGRWPANLLITHDPRCGETYCHPSCCVLSIGAGFFETFRAEAKPPTSEKEAGLWSEDKKSSAELTGRTEGSAGLVMGSDGRANPYAGTSGAVPRANTHPTVKPINLMRWLCRLVTPPGGVVLDPFTGSGSTGCATAIEGFGFVGSEFDEESCKIAARRIEHYTGAAIGRDSKPIKTPLGEGQQDSLF